MEDVYSTLGAELITASKSYANAVEFYNDVGVQGTPAYKLRTALVDYASDIAELIRDANRTADLMRAEVVSACKQTTQTTQTTQPKSTTFELDDDELDGYVEKKESQPSPEELLKNNPLFNLVSSNLDGASKANNLKRFNDKVWLVNNDNADSFNVDSSVVNALMGFKAGDDSDAGFTNAWSKNKSEDSEDDKWDEVYRKKYGGISYV